jgi:hypothetical protein
MTMERGERLQRGRKKKKGTELDKAVPLNEIKVWDLIGTRNDIQERVDVLEILEESDSNGMDEMD